jgi:hypothetical protein
MFQQDTLAQALEAAGTQLTPAEIATLYNQAQDEWADYLDQTEQRLTQRYRQQTGQRIVESMDKITLLNLTRQLADAQIYADYIQPLTDRASEMMSDWDEDEITVQQVLDSTTLWQTHWDLVPINPTIPPLVYEIWPEKTSPWTAIASAYLTVVDYQDGQYPNEPSSSLIPHFEKSIDQAVALMGNTAP